MKAEVKFSGRYKVVCKDKDGNVKWQDYVENMVVDEGLGKILDDVFTGGTDERVTTWYLGLTDDSPTPAAADTLASHGGWVEFDEYTGDRKEWVEVRSDLELSNTASKASFAITGAGGGLGGAFLASVATGTVGTLMSVGALTGGNRTVANSDTVELTYTFAAADA